MNVDQEERRSRCVSFYPGVVKWGLRPALIDNLASRLERDKHVSTYKLASCTQAGLKSTAELYGIKLSTRFLGFPFLNSTAIISF